MPQDTGERRSSWKHAINVGLAHVGLFGPRVRPKVVQKISALPLMKPCGPIGTPNILRLCEIIILGKEWRVLQEYNVDGNHDSQSKTHLSRGRFHRCWTSGTQFWLLTSLRKVLSSLHGNEQDRSLSCTRFSSTTRTTQLCSREPCPRRGALLLHLRFVQNC
jgi:hypothetical protein